VFELHQSLTQTAKCPHVQIKLRPSKRSNAIIASTTTLAARTTFDLLVLLEVCNNVSAIEVPPIDGCPKDSPHSKPNHSGRSETRHFLVGNKTIVLAITAE
jgi:hypothetical protein